MKAQPLSHLVERLKSCFTNKVQTHKIGQGFPTFMGFYLTSWYFFPQLSMTLRSRQITGARLFRTAKPQGGCRLCTSSEVPFKNLEIKDVDCSPRVKCLYLFLIDYEVQKLEKAP